MPLDGANYLSEMNLANPDGAIDTVNTLDDHIREVKKVLQQSFPNIDSPANITSTELNNLKSKFQYVNSVWSLQNTPLTNVASSDSDSAVQPRSYNDGRYLRKSNNLSDLNDTNTSVTNLVNGLTGSSSSIKQLAALIGETLYPVGSIYTNANNGSNPRDILGFGTWSAYGQGRVLIGAGSGNDTRNESRNFNAGSTGGEYQHILSINEMPSHDHNLLMARARDDDRNVNSYDRAGKSTPGQENNDSRSPIQHTGGNSPHNNIQPYVTVYMWRRTT